MKKKLPFMLLASSLAAFSLCACQGNEGKTSNDKSEQSILPTTYKLNFNGKDIVNFLPSATGETIPAEVEKGASVSFKVEGKETGDYTQLNDLSILDNNVAITATDGVYTISDIQEDHSITASATKDMYKVTFHYEDETGQAKTSEKKGIIGASIELPSDEETNHVKDRVHTSVEGWYKEESYVNKVEEVTIDHSNVDLYAKYLTQYEVGLPDANDVYELKSLEGETLPSLVEKDDTLNFKVALSEGYSQKKNLVVKAGDKVLKANDDGAYSVIVNSPLDITVSVDKNVYNVTHTVSDGFTFTGENTVNYGDDYEFTLTPSDGNKNLIPLVKNGEDVLSPNNEGKYSIPSVKADQSISVEYLSIVDAIYRDEFKGVYTNATLLDATEKKATVNDGWFFFNKEFFDQAKKEGFTHMAYDFSSSGEHGFLYGADMTVGSYLRRQHSNDATPRTFRVAFDCLSSIQDGHQYQAWARNASEGNLTDVPLTVSGLKMFRSVGTSTVDGTFWHNSDDTHGVYLAWESETKFVMDWGANASRVAMPTSIWKGKAGQSGSTLIYRSEWLNHGYNAAGEKILPDTNKMGWAVFKFGEDLKNGEWGATPTNSQFGDVRKGEISSEGIDAVGWLGVHGGITSQYETDIEYATAIEISCLTSTNYEMLHYINDKMVWNTNVNFTIA